MAAKNEYSVPALEKSIQILKAIATEGSMSIPSIHEQLQIPKSTAFVILNTLEKHHLIERSTDNNFKLGYGIFLLGVQFYNKIDVRSVARPYMKELVEGTPFTCHLAVLIGSQPVYIDKVEGDGFIRFATTIGQSLPLYASGVGKALAVGMDDEELTAMLVNGMEQLTAKGYRNSEELLEDIRLARQLGYAVEDEQMEEGIRCIGAPVYDAAGAVAAAISLTSTVHHLPVMKIPMQGQAVAACAARISRELGCMSPPASSDGSRASSVDV